MLKGKQELFCQHYVVSLNATEAAIKAGYSEKTAQQMGSENLLKPVIQERIKELQSVVADKLEITHAMLLSEWAKIGFCNLQDYIKEGFKIEDIIELEKDKAAAIESIQVTTNTTPEGYTTQQIKFKLYSKPTALENIGKHIGFYGVDNKQKNPLEGLAEEVFKIAGQTITFK